MKPIFNPNKLTFNMKTKLEQLRSIIIKELPEIMELKFGCRIESTFGDHIVTSGRFEGCWIVDWSGQVCTDTHISEKNITKILGRPITLADVLRVSKKRIAIDNHEEFIRLDKYKNREVPHWMNVYWNLGKDNLNDQSQETISFLLDILSTK